jgi:nucleoside phosphorylase
MFKNLLVLIYIICGGITFAAPLQEQNGTQDMKKILILGHMKEEVDIFRSKIDEWKALGKEVYVDYSGVGKPLAAAKAQQLINSFNPDLIITVGLVGALSSDLNIGDIGIIGAAIDGEIDIRPFCKLRGEFYSGERVFIPSKKYVDKVLEKSKGINTFFAYAATVSTFMTKDKKDKFINDILPELNTDIDGKETFPNIIEMECSAIFQVADLNSIPCLGLCSVSDSLKGDAVKEFNTFIKDSVEKYLPIMDQIIINI